MLHLQNIKKRTNFPLNHSKFNIQCPRQLLLELYKKDTDIQVAEQELHSGKDEIMTRKDEKG